uniref:Pogo transposable element with KRAB domain (Trinotate prediction) n=1 Tax=Henneguya salminicola TaxID=69463 RepID=A0A6G3MI57_HENSL
MNIDIMKLWVDRYFRTRAEGFLNPSSLLKMDSMTSHKDRTARARPNSSGANVAIIPGGLARQLHPLDIAINPSMTFSVRMEWDNWMGHGSKSFTPMGRTKKTSVNEVCSRFLPA